MADGQNRKPILTIEQQIMHLKQKGVSFELCAEAKAARILAGQDHYFRLAAYRVLFPKRVGGPRDGQYAGLDFGHLVDLAAIDRELRGFLLPLTLDVENSAKTRLIERITEKPGEDGYSILSDYLAALNHGDRNRREGELRRLQNDAYLGPLVSRYPIGEMPAWVFLELSSFGAFERHRERAWLSVDRTAAEVPGNVGRGSRRNRHVQAPQALEDAQSAHPADGRSSLRLL